MSWNFQLPTPANKAMKPIIPLIAQSARPFSDLGLYLMYITAAKTNIDIPMKTFIFYTPRRKIVRMFYLLHL